MDQGLGVMEVGVAEAVRADFPQLRLWAGWVAVPPGRKSSPGLLDRLADVDDRARGLPTGRLRTDPVAASYRAFARQIGLDPDAERNPLEQLAIERLRVGRLPSGGPLADAMTVAMLETGVPLWAVASERATGWLSVDADDEGRLVIAENGRPLVPLMASPGEELRPPIHRRTPSTAVVYALQVGKVPTSTVEEAFWHLQAGVADQEIAR
ncbi:hypothetical protein NBH00_04180 [Paraconexibacter antarcticus]|uniref:Uncharacterized protein n=1 Tax=Paraconexibacter antarcticus TaxID=2949664 RepID=A0ABY5DXQ0_9ACTN|nr:hypothetical protein [Paraconexibacter antarcticus]UTI65415.1 hypothetical protein NBH00_04180 [Paraconexibacter antarcticus]